MILSDCPKSLRCESEFQQKINSYHTIGLTVVGNELFFVPLISMDLNG
jgi:hypothetical protein